jgi:Fe-S-cluster containining protein
MLPVNCNRCGLCCTLSVPVTEKEINKIIKRGYNKSFFLDKDTDGSNILKRINGYCVFFSIKDSLPHCSIYKDRPGLCANFPATSRCTFGKHVIFRISENYKAIKKELENKTRIKAPMR